MSLPNQKKHHRKLFLPIFLILFLLTILAYWEFGKLNLSLNWPTLREKEMVSPVSSLTEEEKLENTLKLSGLNTSLVKFLDDSLQATISGSILVFFAKDQDYNLQVASLQFILNRSKIEGKIPQQIDLRFDKPVLRY